MKTQETAQSNTGGPGNRPRCKQARFERAVHWYKLNRRENSKSKSVIVEPSTFSVGARREATQFVSPEGHQLLGQSLPGGQGAPGGWRSPSPHGGPAAPDASRGTGSPLGHTACPAGWHRREK